MSREQVLGSVLAAKVRAHVEHIVRKIPHRAASSANGKRMAEYSREAMVKAGVENTVVHELPAIVSFPEHAEARLLEPTDIAIQANTLGHSLETMPEGISEYSDLLWR